MSINLTSVMLLIRDVAKTSKFFESCLKFKPCYVSESWAELKSGPYTVTMKKVERWFE